MRSFLPLAGVLIPTQQGAALKRDLAPRAEVNRAGQRAQAGRGQTFIVDLEQHVTEVPARGL